MINSIAMGDLLMNLLYFSPMMVQLAHISIYVEKTTSIGWYKRDSINSTYAVGSVLCKIALASRRQHIQSSVGHITWEENKMANST